MIKPIKVPTSGVRQRTKRAEGARVAFSALAWVGFCREFMVGVQSTRTKGCVNVVMAKRTTVLGRICVMGALRSN
jgi:hypothetical protein